MLAISLDLIGLLILGPNIFEGINPILVFIPFLFQIWDLVLILVFN
jgi:hypothetical protein